MINVAIKNTDILDKRRLPLRQFKPWSGRHLSPVSKAPRPNSQRIWRNGVPFLPPIRKVTIIPQYSLRVSLTYGEFGRFSLRVINSEV